MSSQAAGVRDKSSKKISFACEECKRRRSRCSGPPRCERCDTDNTPCIFDAGKDLRTRQSRDADKVHKALLDAFAAAVQGQDDKISHILYDIIRKTDPSGKLAESVQIGTAITTTSTTDTTHVNTPTAVLNSRGSGIRPEDCVPWEWLRAQDFQAHRAGQLLPGFSCDPYNVEPADALSRAYLAFRDAARRQLLTGARTVPELINGPLPVLDQFFGTAPNTNPLSPWTYACQLAGTMTDFPFTLKLATIYVTGLLMRFFIQPCAETYHDLPLMLRPLRQQYVVPHAAGADLCHLPKLKSLMLEEWDEYSALIMAGQSCNWPYSDEACLTFVRGSSTTMTLSGAFVEHISNPRNWSVGPKILQTLPDMKEYVRDRPDG